MMTKEVNYFELFKIMKNKKIICFGASNMGNVISDASPIKIAYFVDNDNQKLKNKINNLNIYEPINLLNEKKNEILIIVTSIYYKEISNQLNELGFKEDKNYINGESLFELFNYEENSNHTLNEKVIELDEKFCGKLINLKPILVQYFNEARFHLMGKDEWYSKKVLETLKLEVYNELENINVKCETEKRFLDYVLDCVNNFENKKNYGRYFSYIEQINKYIRKSQINVWEMCACAGVFSLMLKTLGNKVTVSDAGTPSINSYGYGAANWLRKEIFKFDRNFDFEYNSKNINLISNFNEEIKFDLITTSANASIYLSAMDDVGKDKCKLQDKLVANFKPIIMLLDNGGIFQSRTEAWYHDLDNQNERISKLNDLALRLKETYGVEILDVGIDPNSHRAMNFDLQLVFRK